MMKSIARLQVLLPSFAILLVSVLGSLAAHAQPRSFVLATGAPGGTYRAVYTPNLEKLLPEWQMRTVRTTGSAENLQQLADGSVDLGFVQADIYAGHLLDDPDRYGKLTVVGRLADECIFLVHRKAGPIKKLSDLGERVGDRPARVSVGEEGGGMGGTWRYMSRQLPDLANATVIYSSDTLAINQLDAGILDAVGFVTDPNNFDHKLIRAVNANDSLGLLAIDDPALPNNLPDGTRVYEARALGDGKVLPRKTKTICTGALLLAKEDIAPALLERISDVVSLDRERIVTRRRR